MNINNMKNIIIIKNLPSNLVEEAIVVVKDKKNIDTNCLERSNEVDDSLKNKNVIKGYIKDEDFKKIKEIKQDNRGYVVKEAEMVVNEYLSKIEDNNNYKAKKKIEKRYNKIKYINFILLAISILSTAISIIR